jgi:hypothetical protein
LLSPIGWGHLASNGNGSTTTFSYYYQGEGGGV